MSLGVLTGKFWELSAGVYDNEYLKDTKFGRLMKGILGRMYEEYTGKLYLIPAFSFSLLNLYLLAVSYPNRDADWAVRETLRTYGRAMRDMIMNSWDILELRKLDERLVKFAEMEEIFDTKDIHSVLFPIHTEDEDKRGKTYELIGLIFTSVLSSKPDAKSISDALNNGHYSRITDINIVADLAQDIFDAYDGKKVAKCRDMLKSENLEGALDVIIDDDSNTEVEVTPLDLIILMFNDMLNTNIDTSFKFINRRLINNHTLRQMVYSLYARFFLDFVLDFGPKDISRSLGFRLDLYLLDSVKEVFTGLSGNLRILDDAITWQGEGGNQYSYALKILNVGVKGEEIFDLWLEIRRDVGIAGMDSLLFIPMYPEQNLYGAWEKFNLDKRLAKVERREGEGNVVILTLNHLYDLIRVMLINVDNEPENRAFEVFEQIVKENLL